jgi:hypothetical protein
MLVLQRRTNRAAFDLVEAATRPLLTAGYTEEQAADGIDRLGRPVIDHALTEAGRPPGTTSAAVKPSTPLPSRNYPPTDI